MIFLAQQVEQVIPVRMVYLRSHASHFMGYCRIWNWSLGTSEISHL